MTTTPTLNPVPSESPNDLKFNAGKIDEFVTSQLERYQDRFGNNHYTIEGLKQLTLQHIYELGWNPVGSFQAGATLNSAGDIIQDTSTGIWYRWDNIASLPKTVTSGSTPASTGGVGAGAWEPVDVSDVLRRDLASSSAGKGDALMTVKSSLAGAVARSQHDKNTDYRTLEDFGAIGDGSNHPLSERFSTLTAAQMVYAFVTSLTQSIDWAAAMAASAAGGFSMLSKTYSLSNTLAIGNTVSINGKGDGLSKFLFTGSGDGIVITLPNSTDSKFWLRDFGIYRTGAPSSTTKETALKIDGRAQIVTPGTSTALAQLGYRTEYRGAIENLKIAGSNVLTGGWYRGIHMISVMNFRIVGFQFCGLVPSSGYGFVGDAIVVAGDGYVVDFSISRVWVFYAATGLLFPDYVEGPHLYDFEMMNVTTGIIGGIRLPETVVPDITGQVSSPGVLSPWIYNCHINSTQECILMPSNCNLAKIDKINFFCNPLSTDTQGRAAISMSYCSAPQITNAYVLMDRAANTAYLDANSAVFFGAVVSARVNGLIVSGVSNRGSAVIISGGVTRSKIGEIFTNTKYGIAEAGPTVNSNNNLGKVLPGFGTARFNMPVSQAYNSFDYEKVSISSVITLTGSGGVTEGVINITPISTISAKPAAIDVSIGYSDNLTATAYYDFDSSTATNLVVKVRTQSLSGSKTFRVGIEYPLI